MPEHFEGDWISANNRYAALNDSIFYARGEDIYLDIEGPTGERVATYCDSIAPESACTSVQLHLQVAPQDFAAHWNAAQALVAPAARPGGQLALLLRQAAVRRDAHRAVHPGHRHPQHRAEEPGRPAPRLLRRALDHLDLRPLRGERPLLPGPAAEVSDEDPVAVLDAGGAPSCRAAAAQRHGLPLEPPDLRHRRGPPAPAGREPRAARRADARRRPGQRRLLLRRDPQLRVRRPAGLDAR